VQNDILILAGNSRAHTKRVKYLEYYRQNPSILWSSWMCAYSSLLCPLLWPARATT